MPYQLSASQITLLGKALSYRGNPYKQAAIVDHSYYNDGITVDSNPHGNSRIVGDASAEVQLQAIQAIISAANTAGLSKYDTA